MNSVEKDVHDLKQSVAALEKRVAAWEAAHPPSPATEPVAIPEDPAPAGPVTEDH